MSSPGGASSAFPLHVLVWNNDYRRLDEQLQDQVTGGPGPAGAAGEGLVALKELVPHCGAWWPSLAAVPGRSSLVVLPGAFAGLEGSLRFVTCLFVVWE